MALTTILLTIDRDAIINIPSTVGALTDRNPDTVDDLADGIVINFNNGAVSFNFTEDFYPVRYRPHTVSTEYINDGNEVNAINLANAINLDSSFKNDFVAFANLNTVTITSDKFSATSVTGTMIDNLKISALINSNPSPDVKIVSIDSYSTDISNVCENITLNLEVYGGTQVYNVYVDEVLSLSNQSTPIPIVLKRGDVNNIRVVDIFGEIIGSLVSNNPRKLISSDVSISVLNLNSGTNLTVTVAYISPYVSVYEYSIDGVTFSSSNIFTSLTSGNYTIYVRDALGCTVSKSIVVDGYTTETQTNFYISDINPIRYSKYEPSSKKNYTNTLSFNSLRLTKYPYIQQFIDGDSPITQFKTNASHINVFTLGEDLSIVSIPAIKKTENIGLSAKSTCTYFNIGDGKSGVYFGSVDLLNPISDTVIDNIDYGFSLPIWANSSDSYVTIDGIGEVKIDSIGYSDIYNSFILEFNISYTGNPISSKISANYNLQPYEVYEFELPITSLQDSFNTVIEVGKSLEEIEFTYVSEKIKKVNDSEFLFEIDYWDDANIGGMVYQTGVKHKLRINGYVDYLGEQSTEGYDGDSKYYVTDNTVYNTNKFTFNRLSIQMAQKLRLIVAHGYLYINGLSYQLSEAPEISGDSNFNLKTFFVTLKNDGNQILTSSTEQIVDTPESLEIASGITAIKGKALLLWTKING